MTTLTTLSAADLGALINKSGDWVERKVIRAGHEHLRVGREMRFTDDQAETFIRSFTTRTEVTDGPAPATPTAVPAEDPLLSQSTRSRRRHK
ncbi:hypothetical protein ACFQHV_01175 [Promicromonospora thailandica]|uniref:Uncharacterized protein n=1 Tax=Promicromonospora thailandica TaxID=765201 RepID=A0A9X2JYY9_9MICO|nr:hypothetical protein [Promicromonospora thailandica]MCP2265534.1 hypothetical protein [Promicromonospora thailandica]BFF17100.1 hypothetical protein GCM10025730_06210 [Promicromonospora thailandica]